ncbi:MAG: O-antigen ligase family protein [Clostridia bacterium]|nr:O-antigen ligase family protein [Clostridia bacterium]
MIFRKCAQKPAFQALNAFVNSKYCIAALAFLTLCSNVFGAELLIYTVVFLFGVYFVLFGRDLLPLAPAVMLMYVSPSVHNNPANNPDSIFYPANGLWLIIAYLIVFFTLVIVRICLRGGIKKFFAQKRAFALALLLLGATFLLGGLGSEYYAPHFILNIRYGALVFISLFVVYYILAATVDFKNVPKEYFAWCGVFLAITVSLEVLAVYLANGVIGINGKIHRLNIYTGWGVYNNMACMIVMGIPSAFYLAAIRKRGYLYNLLATALYIAVIFSNSRNGMLMGLVVYAVSALCLLIARPYKWKETFLLFGLYAAVLIGLLAFDWNGIAMLFSEIATIDFDDAGRIPDYIEGLEQFLDKPLFGNGFFSCTAFKWGEIAEQMTFLPKRWHNTYVQLLASCGLAGFVAYALHRFQTVKTMLKRRDIEAVFIGLSIFSLALLSLLDCHFFNIGPGLSYSVYLLFLERSAGENELHEAIKNRKKLLRRGKERKREVGYGSR